MNTKDLTPKQIDDIITHAKLFLDASKEWMDIHHESVPTPVVLQYNELEEALDAVAE